MLAEQIDHVIGIDPDRDRVTAAVAAADTTAVIDTADFATTSARDRAKTDTLDAVRATRGALGRTRLAQPRTGCERQGLRALTVARDSAQRARVAAINELRSVIVTAPVEMRDQLAGLTRGALIDRCARLRTCGEHAALKAALRGFVWSGPSLSSHRSCTRSAA